MSSRKIIGENIRGFRRSIGLSQTEFAEKINLNRSHLSSIERGEENPTIDTLERVATVLGIPLHILMIERSYNWSQSKPKN